MLQKLRLKQVGPAPEFDVEFAERLNIFTGDNGLGKTFLLDIAWWTLTGNWIDQPAYPQRQGQPEITCHVDSPTDSNNQDYHSSFDFDQQQWRKPLIPYPFKGIVIYARADGGFSVVDPARKRDTAYNFTANTLWNGLRSGKKVICKGLIDDWVKWQIQPDQTQFNLLSQVIHKLAPHPGEWIEPGEPTRISVEDIRDFPTVNLPYGNVPIVHVSNGMKRILGLAYLLVWTWYEHCQASKLRQNKASNQIIFLMDEVESHLHPRWQRTILPAILEVIKGFQDNLNVQILITTHSPLVLASIEPIFKDERDRLFLFELQGESVTLDAIPWTKQGDSVGWLTSEIFGLKQARSKQAEQAIEAAEAWMRHDDMSNFPDDLRTKDKIHQQLLHLLPGHDPFFPRWIVTMEKRQA
ncbi:MAG: ATP-binding protein [Coleofasciculus sp. D1-CHI-01]|uniref:AAA family ATPase n=1 Tax=Coleofasciculus sp. D1-CHI-01 TaxID=3068482 RepID=UPI0032FF0ADE